MKARKIALSLNLKVSGTIGFLIKSYRLGLINSAFENVNKLKKAGFYISEALLENIKLEENKFENR